MNAVAQIAAITMGLILVTVFVCESFLFRRRELYPFFLIEPGEEAAVRLWTVNQGFYNLCFGIAALGGVALVDLGYETVGQTLVVFTAVSMIVLGVVLFFSERRLWRSTILCCLPPTVLLVALA
ncbi:MAG: DUF1304 family protein [Nocardioidaceae bacterium]